MMLSAQILDELLQLKQYFTNMLPTFRVIISRPIMGTNDEKAALTLSNLNKHFGQLEAEFIDNVNIKKVDLGKKGLHLNKKIKNRAEFYSKVTVSLMVCGILE